MDLFQDLVGWDLALVLDLLPGPVDQDLALALTREIEREKEIGKERVCGRGREIQEIIHGCLNGIDQLTEVGVPPWIIEEATGPWIAIAEGQG